MQHSIDATALQKRFTEASFHCCIFNFPHTGEQRVHSNQAMLRGFFKSARCALSRDQLPIFRSMLRNMMVQGSCTTFEFREKLAVYACGFVYIAVHCLHVVCQGCSSRICLRKAVMKHLGNSGFSTRQACVPRHTVMHSPSTLRRSAWQAAAAWRAQHSIEHF